MTKLTQLQKWFDDKGRVLVALSGGVDSALVAYAAYSKLKNDCMAVTADYKTLSAEELSSAKKVCTEIGIKHKIIIYDELSNERFAINDKNRCFYCRSELGEHLRQLAVDFSFDTIVDGTNLDDLGDFRPGIKALRQYNIRSPLLETSFTKADVRVAAKQVGLSVHDRPSNSCLASRIPWGQRITSQRLARIELAETIVKQIVKVHQVRVRDIGGKARIEVGSDELNLLTPSIRTNVESRLELIGFSSVEFDPTGYKAGKINVMFD